MQFNFELPEAEANRLLDLGVARRLGTTRETVSKAIIARALVLERLDELAPVDGNAELLEEVTAALADPDTGKLLKPKLERFLRTNLRAASGAAA